MTENYKKAFADAQVELDQLLHLKDKTEKRIAQLRQFIASTIALNREDAPEDEADDTVHIPSPMQLAARQAAQGMAAFVGRTMGFTDAVREVLKASGGWMTPTHVKNGLIRMGIDLDAKYSNPLAVIHTTLKRLDDNEEVAKDTHPTAGTVYKWKTAAASLPTLSSPSASTVPERGGPEHMKAMEAAEKRDKLDFDKARRKRAERESAVPTRNDSLREAAGLPPQRRKSALQDYAEKLNKKEEKE